MAEDVSLKVVIDHMVSMEQRLTQRIDQVDIRVGKLDKKIDDVEARLTQRIDSVEMRLTRQIDGIDQRLDAIEIESLPKRVSALEKAVFH